jgi:hypothetical protein
MSMEAAVMKIDGRWWYFPGDAINTILWELTYRQGVPYLHECTGNMVRGIEVEAVEIGRPKPLTMTSATQPTNFDNDVFSLKQKGNE